MRGSAYKRISNGASAGVRTFLRAYKRFISPMLLPSCRFVPSCSEYAASAFELHPPLRATMLVIGRLARCNPFSRGGLDAVPAAHELHTHSSLCSHPRH